MLRRRDLLLAAPLFLAAGAGFALQPRNRLSLLGDQKLEDIVPLAFDGWEVTPSNAMILPKPREGSLADVLYDQQVSRLYTGEGRRPIMLVIAYGSTQSDTLQLHRPETCYRAIGFDVSGSERVDVDVAGASIPMRRLTASSNERIEPILYWTRLGDHLPTSNNEQRLMKLRTEMSGYIADGVLVRMSTVADPEPQVFKDIEQFSRSMLKAMGPSDRPALIGRPASTAMGKTPGASAA